MTRFLRLTAAAVLIFAGLGNAQEQSARIPSLQVGIIDAAITDSANDAMWKHEQRTLDTGDADGHSNQAWEEEADLYEWETYSIESPVTEHGNACNCGGKKHCHGVCRDPGHPKKPKREKPGDVDRGDCPPLRYRIPDCRRAGNPHCVAKWAKCSVNEKYSAWFTGGGAAFCRGRHRHSSEGTWGLDYNGFFGHANVWLKYTRDRVQGGEGKYETDGEPKFVSRAHNLLRLGH